MAASRAVRIPRLHSAGAAAPTTMGTADLARERTAAAGTGATHGRRRNGAGTQRAVRLTICFLVALVAIYAGFALYDRGAPGGSAPALANGMLLFAAIFVAFAVFGSLYTLYPAPRALEVGEDHVTVVGRFGRRRRFPRLELLSVRVVRSYPAGWLAESPVELVEVWGEDTGVHGYLVETGLFAGAKTSPRAR